MFEDTVFPAKAPKAPKVSNSTEICGSLSVRAYLNMRDEMGNLIPVSATIRRMHSIPAQHAQEIVQKMREHNKEAISGRFIATF